MIRKAIEFATVYLDISVYTSKCPETSEPAMNIDVLQTATGGLAGTTEKRRLDWTMQKHTDYIFGNVSGWSRLVGGLRDQEGNTRPNFEVQTKVDDERVADFLKAKILPDGTQSGGLLVEAHNVDDRQTAGGNWVHTFEHNESSGWTAEQVSVSNMTWPHTSIEAKHVID